MRLLLIVGCFALPLCGALGCGKTMTKEECSAAGDHISKVWTTEAELSAPDKGPRSERAMTAIKVEGERMRTEWMALCERELEGRKVDEQEVECLLRAKTVAAIQSCGLAKK